jgi:hypothetical protein
MRSIPGNKLISSITIFNIFLQRNLDIFILLVQMRNLTSFLHGFSTGLHQLLFTNSLKYSKSLRCVLPTLTTIFRCTTIEKHQLTIVCFAKFLWTNTKMFYHTVSVPISQPTQKVQIMIQIIMTHYNNYKITSGLI